MDFGFAAMPSITIICFFVGNVVKKGKAQSNIPVVCMATGAILSILAFYCIPELTIAGNILDAIGVGITSGGTATAARFGMGDGISGTDDFAQPDNDDRRADHGSSALQTRADARGGAAPLRGTA